MSQAQGMVHAPSSDFHLSEVAASPAVTDDADKLRAAAAMSDLLEDNTEECLVGQWIIIHLFILLYRPPQILVMFLH